MNIDLDKYFDAQKPTVTVFGKTYEVDNDYKKVLGVDALQKELKNDKASMHKFLAYGLVGGDRAADELMAHDMPFDFFVKLQLAVTAAMTGQSMESIEKAAKEAQDGRFHGGAKKRV